MYGSLGTRVYASLVTMCIEGRVTFKINDYFVLVARRCCLLKQPPTQTFLGSSRVPPHERKCIRNWPLPIWAFQDQCKQIVITKHSLAKNPNWREARPGLCCLRARLFAMCSCTIFTFEGQNAEKKLTCI